ncbi:hypothetical protein MON38_21380 [Hymenobacter sp. DH14]|uniref:Uncharacterized protein n=1 Tax=Hymenobacter cyanobacteriorum TaxID=2926463 RepID=A0A9X2AJP0_9BACT|nr:DUF6624 domain-containing protein [Hymenobacter cyanobacteriorum]MCI1189985.1 hypothetical protein [Hymenobacter cyanobacteriorum]
MKPLLLLLLALLPLLAAAQAPPQNPRLKHELDSIYAVDQKWRGMLFDPRQRHRPDSLARALGVTRESLPTYLPRQMLRTDSTNQVRVQQILKRYGYPGKTLVSEPTNEAAWYVIQHSPGIDQYLPLIKKAADKGELPFYLYAQMLDRQLMRAGKPQVYGTQAFGYNVLNPQTGRHEAQPPFVWPIKDPQQVNERRKKAGFPTTVEQNAANLGIPYRVLTLKDVEKMPKN